MRRFFGILLLFVLISASARAEDVQIPVNDNIKNNVQKEQPQNEQSQKEQPPKEKTKKIKQEKNKTVQNTDFVLNDKVYNMMFKPQPQLRPDGIIYQETQTYINAINPRKTDSAGYPGQRGPNQLIVYTPLYGARTGTNEFGTEAIVEDNMVVALNGADSVIPQNGFVVSGHGRAKKWITSNLQVGSKVYIDYETGYLKVFLTPESLIFAAKEKLNEINGLVEYYKKLDILYNDKKANEYLNASKDYLKKAEKKPEKTKEYISEAMETLDSAIKNAIPYMKNELKGIWLRPTERNEEEIVRTVEKLSDSGITDIFLETYFHGKTIYPSEYLKECGVINQRSEFNGFDPLEIWIREAHKKNMKIHIWFETFYVGNDNPSSNPYHVLNVYPSWANKRLYNYNATEPTPSLSEHNGYFLDPSNVQVQTYLMGILNEIVTKYKPDGINLDYIRYPQTVDPSYSNYASMNWGYTENARNDFMSLYGIDPVEIQYGTPEWENWSVYRQNQITKFVMQVQELTKPKNIMLTAVIFPDLKKCVATKMQNWKSWSVNNYVDGLTPLILTGDKNTADVLLNDVIKNTNSGTNIYPGLFVTFMGGSMEDLLLQIQKTREFHSKGAILFDYAHLSDKYIDALTTRVFNKAYNPRDVKIKSNQRSAIVEPKRKNRRKRDAED